MRACVGGVQLRWRVWGAIAVDATWPVWRQGNGSWMPAGERLAGQHRQRPPERATYGDCPKVPMLTIAKTLEGQLV